jgi:hypothetical protein
MLRFRTNCLLFLVCVLYGGPVTAKLIAQECKATHFENAKLVALAADYSSLTISDCVAKSGGGSISCSGCPYVNVAVTTAEAKEQLKAFHVGDRIQLDITKPDAGATLQKFYGAVSVDVSRWSRVLVLAISVLAIYLLAALVTRGHPLIFIVGMDNRYSNSKAQIALWFLLLISSYVAAMVLRVWYAGWDFLGAVNIPENLLLLSGLSALTYGGAKAITTSKVDAAPPANPLAPTKTVAQSPSFLKDLCQNDAGNFDFGDFQMLVVVCLAVVTYLLLFFHFFETVTFVKSITLPDVDTTILSVVGLGQGAYLAKKAGGDLGTT